MNILNNLGLSISYNRDLELENMLATAVCKQFEDEGVVCPAKLQKGLFVVGALDNLDYNPSSTTAQDSFHGTGISVFQIPTINIAVFVETLLLSILALIGLIFPFQKNIVMSQQQLPKLMT